VIDNPPLPLGDRHPFGIFVVIVVSIVQFRIERRQGAVGVAAGTRLQPFAAPVATSNLVGDANLSKPCSLARFWPARAVNNPACSCAGARWCSRSS